MNVFSRNESIDYHWMQTDENFNEELFKKFEPFCELATKESEAYVIWGRFLAVVTLTEKKDSVGRNIINLEVYSKDEADKYIETIPNVIDKLNLFNLQINETNFRTRWLSLLLKSLIVALKNELYLLKNAKNLTKEELLILYKLNLITKPTVASKTNISISSNSINFLTLYRR